MVWVKLLAAMAVLLFGVATASAGSVSGQVTDHNGAPLAGVHVEIVYQTFRSGDLMTYGASIKAEAITDRSGNYAIDIGHLPPGEYAAHAYRIVSNGGRKVNVDLVPDDATSFAGNTDTTRNFTDGVVESSDDLPYGNGGVFVLNNAIMDYTDLTGAEVTLVDAASGQVFTRTVRSTGEGLAVTGIPFGTYRASVTLNGQPLQVQLWGPGVDETFRDSVVHDFTMGWAGNQFQVAVRP